MRDELRGGPNDLAQKPSMFVKHPSERRRHPSPFVGCRYETGRDALRRVTGAVGVRRGARDVRKEAVVIRRDALGLRIAALGARRAAVGRCLDARRLRTVSLRMPTNAPFLRTAPLGIRSAPFVRTDGCSTSSQRRRPRSMGSSLRRRGCSHRTSRRSLQTSGCSSHSRRRRANERRRFAKNLGVIAHCSSCSSQC
jgi:hypothetical protein